MTYFIGGVIVGLLLATFDVLFRMGALAPTTLIKSLYKEKGEIITTGEPLVEAIKQ